MLLIGQHRSAISWLLSQTSCCWLVNTDPPSAGYHPRQVASHWSTRIHHQLAAIPDKLLLIGQDSSAISWLPSQTSSFSLVKTDPPSAGCHPRQVASHWSRQIRHQLAAIPGKLLLIGWLPYQTSSFSLVNTDPPSAGCYPRQVASDWSTRIRHQLAAIPDKLLLIGQHGSAISWLPSQTSSFSLVNTDPPSAGCHPRQVASHWSRQIRHQLAAIPGKLLLIGQHGSTISSLLSQASCFSLVHTDPPSVGCHPRQVASHWFTRIHHELAAIPGKLLLIGQHGSAINSTGAASWAANISANFWKNLKWP